MGLWAFWRKDPCCCKKLVAAGFEDAAVEVAEAMAAAAA